MTVRSNYHTSREYHDSYNYIEIRNYLECSRVPIHKLHVAALQPRLRLAVAQGKYCNTFQLTHMPHGTHAQSIAEDKTLLQHSQLPRHGEFWHASVSKRQRSWACGQNLRVPFLRTVLPPEVEESNGGHGETKALISPPPR